MALEDTPQPAAAVDFEDAGERIKNLLSLAMFVERARQLTENVDAAASRHARLRELLVERGIAYADGYFEADESAGLQVLLQHARELAEQVKVASMAMAQQIRKAA